jgi:predicted nucleic acid-binding protein
LISEAALKRAVTGQKVLIDSNIIIYLTDAVQPYGLRAQFLFKMIEAGDAQAVISILSIAEVMQGALRKGYNSAAREVRDYLVNFPNSHFQEITFEVLEKVGNDPRVDWKGLRTVDSLIVASGIINHVDLFITNDRHFKKSLQQNMILSFDK